MQGNKISFINHSNVRSNYCNCGGQYLNGKVATLFTENFLSAQDKMSSSTNLLSNSQ